MSNDYDPMEDNPYQAPEAVGPINTSSSIGGSFKPFNVQVKSLDGQKLRGVYKCEIFPKAIVLRKGKKSELRFVVGTSAIHIRNAQLEVANEDGRLQLTIAKQFCYKNKLTYDLVEFLSGRLEYLNPDDYKIPGYLMFFALLPIGIPILSLGGALPVIIAALFVGLASAAATNEKLPHSARLIMILAVDVIAYVVAGGLIFALMKAGPGL